MCLITISMQIKKRHSFQFTFRMALTLHYYLGYQCTVHILFCQKLDFIVLAKLFAQKPGYFLADLFGSICENSRNMVLKKAQSTKYMFYGIVRDEIVLQNKQQFIFEYVQAADNDMPATLEKYDVPKSQHFIALWMVYSEHKKDINVMLGRHHRSSKQFGKLQPLGNFTL